MLSAEEGVYGNDRGRFSKQFGSGKPSSGMTGCRFDLEVLREELFEDFTRGEPKPNEDFSDRGELIEGLLVISDGARGLEISSMACKIIVTAMEI